MAGNDAENMSFKWNEVDIHQMVSMRIETFINYKFKSTWNAVSYDTNSIKFYKFCVYI